ncbi:MAG: roadblock/LC7 domain-containing protein [Anaerolinea sp.]|nr:roadblock/LC7 domain-containing protein [Anaerolinea sp.]
MSQEERYRLRSGLTIVTEQSQQLEQLLAQLQQKVPANFVILVDVTGQVVTVKGDVGKTNLVMLGSLVAGDLAASQEIARLTGEYQDFQIVLREGQESHIFIAEAGQHMAMLIQVSNEVPLGWARMLIRHIGQEIAQVLAVQPLQEPSWDVAEADDDLSDLFADALDDVWLE